MGRKSRSRLEDFVQSLEDALGDQLVNVVRYGEAVRGSYPEQAPQDRLLVILRDARPPVLRPIGRAIAGWVKVGQPAPLIFSQREWREATDVFPIEIEDMREAHELLRGDDPFDGLGTTIVDLRHELEREVRGKLLQLRAEFAAVEPDARLLTELVIASAKTFLILFRGVLRANGMVPPREPAALVAATADLAGMDIGAFDWVLKRLASEKAPGLKPFDAVAARYVEAIEHLANFVDRMAQAGETA